MNNIEDKLNKIKAKSLSQAEKNTLWQGISHDINQANNLSFFSLLFARKATLNIAIAILVVLGGSIATVQASDKAKPGDALYPLDRAVENIQISLASQANKDNLKIKFAQERASEIHGVVDKKIDQDKESQEDKNENNNSASNDVEEPSHDALEYIIKVRNELFDKNNQRAVDDLDILLKSMQDSLDLLPEDMKVNVDIEEENNKARFRINFKNEDGEFKIKYKSEENNQDKVELEEKNNSDNNRDNSKENKDEEIKKIETKNEDSNDIDHDREDEDREDEDREDQD